MVVSITNIPAVAVAFIVTASPPFASFFLVAAVLFVVRAVIVVEVARLDFGDVVGKKISLSSLTVEDVHVCIEAIACLIVSAWESCGEVESFDDDEDSGSGAFAVLVVFVAIVVVRCQTVAVEKLLIRIFEVTVLIAVVMVLLGGKHVVKQGGEWCSDRVSRCVNAGL